MTRRKKISKNLKLVILKMMNFVNNLVKEEPLTKENLDKNCLSSSLKKKILGKRSRKTHS